MGCKTERDDRIKQRTISRPTKEMRTNRYLRKRPNFMIRFTPNSEELPECSTPTCSTESILWMKSGSSLDQELFAVLLNCPKYGQEDQRLENLHRNTIAISENTRRMLKSELTRRKINVWRLSFHMTSLPQNGLHVDRRHLSPRLIRKSTKCDYTNLIRSSTCMDKPSCFQHFYWLS